MRMVTNIGDFISGAESKYPSEILKGRKTYEGNVIACIYADPLLIDETDLKTTNFLTSDGVFYFALAKELRKKGYSVFDEVTILSSISDTIEQSFIERGGFETIQNLTDIVNTKNYEVFLDQLYRENIIIGMYNNGFNLLSPVEDNGKEIIPLKLFRKMDSESVLDWYESRLSTFGTGYTSKVLEEEDIDIDDEFLQRLEDGEENGCPFDIAGDDINLEEMRCLPFLSNQIGGLMDSTFSILAGYSSVGKTTIWITIAMALAYHNRKILIISNEQKVKVFKIGFLIWILYKYYRYYDITKKKITSGELTAKDKEYIKKAQQYWRDNYKGKIRFVGIADADMSLVKKKIRQNVLQSGFDTVLYDTLKIDFSDNSNDQAWISLIKDSREFDKISKKYNIIMLASLQLAINTLGKLFLDASVLSMSKQIKEVLEVLLLMRSVYSEELDIDNKKFYCNPFQLKKINCKWIEEEYKPDPAGVYKMLFVDKSRNGQNSSDSGVAYLLKFDGGHGIFKEVAMARPKHGFIQ